MVHRICGSDFPAGFESEGLQVQLRLLIHRASHIGKTNRLIKMRFI